MSSNIDQAVYWNTYHKTVEQTLSVQRSTDISQIKRVIVGGKPQFETRVDKIHTLRSVFDVRNVKKLPQVVTKIGDPPLKAEELHKALKEQNF